MTAGSGRGMRLIPLLLLFGNDLSHIARHFYSARMAKKYCHWIMRREWELHRLSKHRCILQRLLTLHSAKYHSSRPGFFQTKSRAAKTLTSQKYVVTP